MTKTCRSCGETKPLAEFHVRKDSKDGYRNDCKLCVNMRSAQWVRDHPEQAAKSRRQYATAKPEVGRAAKKRYVEAHPERRREQVKKSRAKHGDARRTWAKANYAKNQERILEQVKASQRKARMEVLIHYSGDPPSCACCGETEYAFLTLDHVNGDGAAHRRRERITSRGVVGGGTRLVAWIRRNNYPEGFRVLCANCNGALGFYGYCPHGNIPPVPTKSGRPRSINT
jgi:hypothetical protein